MKLFRNKYKEVISIINEVLANNHIAYEIKIADRRSTATMVVDGVEKEIPLSFMGIYKSSQTILSIDSIQIYPKSILNICKQHKVDYITYTRKMLDLMLTNLKYNVIPSSRMDSIIKDMV